MRTTDFTQKEINMLTIYKSSLEGRKGTIKTLINMSRFFFSDWEMRTTAIECIKKLNSMTDEEFQTLSFILN